MKWLLFVVLVLAECSIASAGPRWFRPRNQVWVCPPQPACCQPIPICAEAPRPPDTCTCAIEAIGSGGGVTLYRAEKCPSKQMAGLSGNFTLPASPGCPNPFTGSCPTGPNGHCVAIRNLKSGGQGFQHYPGTKLTEDIPAFDKAFDLMKPTAYRATDLFAGGKKTVAFTINKQPFIAKLHLIQLEEKSGPGWKLVGQFPIGLECKPPTGEGNEPTLLTAGVTKIDANVVELEIGGVTYQVITKTPIP